MSEITKSYFDEKAAHWIDESYDKGPTIAHTRLKAIIELIRSYGPSSALDIGCGDGRLLHMLDNVKVRAGIDYSNRMIQLASANNSPIQFTQVDLNSDEDLTILRNVGRFDVVTMMGVIHYLSAPTRSVRAFQNCMNSNARLVISFRNRLLNAKQTSKYFESSLTQENLNKLNDEIYMWGRVGLSAENIIEASCNDPTGHTLARDIRQSGTFEGITDNYWNPEKFEHWRQFTPLEAAVMFEQSGFQTERIVPLVNEVASDETQQAIQEAIANCSSFLVIAKLHESAE